MIRLSEANTAQSTLDKVKADHDGKLEVLDCVVEAKVLEGKLTVYPGMYSPSGVTDICETKLCHLFYHCSPELNTCGLVDMYCIIIAKVLFYTIR